VRVVAERAFSPVPASEMGRAVDTLLLAFATDPVERWMYPEARDYLTHFPAFIRAFAGPAFEEETVWSLGGELSAVSLWLPPSAAPDGDALVDLLGRTVDEAKHSDTFAVLEQLGEAHPTYAHWYMPWLGVDPARQGQGLGGELLAQCLGIVDRDHLPVYLETSNPRTVSFYERHGFEQIAEARAGSCPPVACMLRAAP
jgi:ribosomal protein S18 acetylase RimI-like enzyme